MDKIEVTVKVTLDSDSETIETVLRTIKDVLGDAFYDYRKTLKIEAVEVESTAI